MCYKYSVTKDQKKLEDYYHIKVKPDVEYKPYYHANAFSVPKMPVITEDEPDAINLLEWGLIPQFAKNSVDAAIKRKGNMNARSETVFDLPSFRGSVYKKRCLIAADSIFESMDFNGVKYPHRIYMPDDQLFSMGGIYTNWKDESGVWHQSFSIITTPPNKLFSKIHNIKLRMPLILPREKERVWLRPDLLKEEIQDLMIPLNDGVMKAHPISRDINQTKINSNQSYILNECEYPELALLGDYLNVTES